MLEQKVITIYHGTKDPNLKVDYNNKNNDYGKGFYTTPYADLGREWAYASYTRGDKGYLYEYSLDLSDLEVLNLTEKDSVHWVADLITNRTLNTENKEALRDTIELFKKKYKLDTSHTDVIIGYRADDSYFTYAEEFINGAIYKDTLEAVLRNGNLGIQVFIKSEKAFKALKQVGTPVEVPSRYKEYYEKRDKWCLSKDMENMGYLFEYCDKYCFDIYHVHIDKIRLMTAFMNSQFRRTMEKGHPKLLSQSARDSLKQWIDVDYNGDLTDFLLRNDNNSRVYAYNQFYWVGWMYAYLHYKTRLSSKTIVSRLPIEMMLSHYNLGHEMSKESYYARAGRKLKFEGEKMKM